MVPVESAESDLAPVTLKDKDGSLNLRAIFRLARESVSAWIDDFAPSMGAAISYYTIFSIAPLLLIVSAVAGIVFGSDAAAGRIYGELASLVGSDGARAIQAMVASASEPERSIIGTIVG